jgi:hypothetical protein
MDIRVVVAGMAGGGVLITAGCGRVPFKGMHVPHSTATHVNCKAATGNNSSACSVAVATGGGKTTATVRANGKCTTVHS